MTPEEAYNKIMNPPIFGTRHYILDYVAEDDYMQAKLMLEEFQKEGILEIIKTNDVLTAYRLHGIIIKLHRDKIMPEMEILKPTLSKIGNIISYMDNLYISDKSEYITLTKQIYKENLV
ncbi:MAG: hypothetical protein K6F00_11230 [Lachnospiraceae bacterium]|nr:hypothetical protein [Lachnospiraceae bacterium]